MTPVWHLPFEGAPGTYGGAGKPRVHQIQLTVEDAFDGEMFFEHFEVYPVTIVQARYSGNYEGAPWLCLPTSPDDLQRDFWRDWAAGDLPCAGFWDRARAEDWPIGYGPSPTDARNDLIGRVARLVGVSFETAG